MADPNDVASAADALGGLSDVADVATGGMMPGMTHLRILEDLMGTSPALELATTQDEYDAAMAEIRERRSQIEG